MFVSRITGIITAFITIERCMCVTMPLKVKNIITRDRTKIIISFIFLVTIAIFIPECYVNKLVWIFHSPSNTSKLILVHTEDREVIETVTFIIHSVFMSSICMLAVLICTIILVIKLSSTAKWRKTASSHSDKVDVTAVRDRKVVKMVGLLAVIFIVCVLPGTILFLVMAYDTEFSFVGKYQNSFFVVWCVSFVLETINSSVNIIVYILMSSKFKVTLVTMFCGGWAASVS